MQFDDYSPFDYAEYDDNDEPVCVCPDYVGATHPVFCKACLMWTDDAELLADIAADEAAPIPVISSAPPAYKMNISLGAFGVTVSLDEETAA